MLTSFVKNINWVDVGLFVLCARVILISVKTGFVVEVFKFLGVLGALFVSLHYYAVCAAWAVRKIPLSPESWQFLMFTGLCGVIILAFKFLRDGILLLFKVQTTHQGFDKYAAGFLGAGRAIFLSTLVIFALLLLRHEYIHRQTVLSKGYQITAKAGPNTYSFLYHQVIGKLFEGEKFNADVFAVVGHGAHLK